MQRLPDWQSRLFKLIADHEQVPFAYGRHDCALWSGRVVEAVTGDDFYSAYLGKYKTKLGGYRAFKKATDSKSHIEFIQNNFEAIPPSFARLGDLGIVNTAEGEAVVLIAGSILIGVGPNGLNRLPISELISAYKIGE